MSLQKFISAFLIAGIIAAIIIGKEQHERKKIIKEQMNQAQSRLHDKER